MSYTRDASEDLVWNSSTNSYELANTPATSGFLTDGNGNIFLFNGKAIYINVAEPVTYAIQFVLSTGSSSFTIDEETYTSSTTVNLSAGSYSLTTTGKLSTTISSSYGTSTTFNTSNTVTLIVSSSNISINNTDLGPTSSILTITSSNSG